MANDSEKQLLYYKILSGFFALIFIIFSIFLFFGFTINPILDLGNIIVGCATVCLAIATIYLVLINKDYLESHNDYVKLLNFERKSKNA